MCSFVHTMSEAEQKYLYESIGSRIRSLRKKAEISQLDLAKRLDLSRVSIVNIEKGRQHPSLHLLIDLARIFDTSVHDFFVDEAWSNAESREKLSRIKKQISQTTQGDSVKMVTDFVEFTTQKNNS